MNTQGNNLPTIAVLRGGAGAKKSLEEGVDILRSLSHIGYVPLDVLVSESGEWTLRGVPTDAHYVFTLAEIIVDTTRTRNAPYQKLAKEMGVSLLFSHDDSVSFDRETMYRLLRQQGISTPKTHLIRANTPVTPVALKTIWHTFHTPLMVRPVNKGHGSSALIRKFKDLEMVLQEYQKADVDAHILTYRDTPTTSVAVLPQFRGQKIYTSLPLETFPPKGSLPRTDHPMRGHAQALHDKKEAMIRAAHDAYNALGLSTHACIDMIPHKDGYMVVNIDTTPSLHKESRFVRALEATGVDIGQYVHAQTVYDGAR